MKRINNYILEKFKIANDISDSSRKRPEKIMLFTDLYQIGDRCLLLYCFTKNRVDYVKIDVIEITRILKTKINYKKLTDLSRSLDYNNHESNTNNFEMHFTKASNEDILYGRNKFLSSSGMNHTKFIVPEYEAEDILNSIEKEQYKIDFYKTLWGSRNSSDWPMEKVIKISPDAELWNSNEKDFIQINHEDIVTLRKAL